MRTAREKADRMVVSLYVNPTQFSPGEDLEQYPRNMRKDIHLAENEGVHCLFTPDSSEMYPDGFQTWVEVTKLSKGLCGKSRQDHFRGVATIVAKLFNIVQPDVAVFGQKDYQQLQIIRRMVEDLNISVEIVGYPIIREKDGLAMSSRNTYLSQEERKSAVCLWHAINRAHEMVAAGMDSCSELANHLREYIKTYPATRIDYIFIGDPDTLEKKETIEARTLLAMAVWVGKTRLIDNTILMGTSQN